MKTIEIEFDDSGNPTIHVKGVSGPGCKVLTKALEDDFGSKKTSTNTHEYRAATTIQQQTTNA
jgi:hypothetical protein